MQVIQGGVQDLNDMTEAAAEEAAEFLSEILISLETLKLLLRTTNMTIEQYDKLEEEVQDSDN